MNNKKIEFTNVQKMFIEHFLIKEALKAINDETPSGFNNFTKEEQKTYSAEIDNKLYRRYKKEFGYVDKENFLKAAEEYMNELFKKFKTEGEKNENN